MDSHNHVWVCKECGKPLDDHWQENMSEWEKVFKEWKNAGS